MKIGVRNMKGKRIVGWKNCGGSTGTIIGLRLSLEKPKP